MNEATHSVCLCNQPQKRKLGEITGSWDLWVDGRLRVRLTTSRQVQGKGSAITHDGCIALKTHPDCWIAHFKVGGCYLTFICFPKLYEIQFLMGCWQEFWFKVKRKQQLLCEQWCARVIQLFALCRFSWAFYKFLWLNVSLAWLLGCQLRMERGRRWGWDPWSPACHKKHWKIRQQLEEGEVCPSKSGVRR